MLHYMCHSKHRNAGIQAFISLSSLILIVMLFIGFLLAFKSLVSSKEHSTIMAAIHIVAIFISILALSFL